MLINQTSSLYKIIILTFDSPCLENIYVGTCEINLQKLRINTMSRMVWLSL